MERAYMASGQTKNAKAAQRAAEALEYELARKIGDTRFGSECKHEQTRNGVCLNCQRKVI